MKVISGEPICNSPLNHSKSKYMYSFSKAQRFPPISNSFGSVYKFYNLPSVRTKRSTSIGYGTKYDFTHDAKSKSPVFYNFKSDFDPKNPRMDRAGPGPAKYNIRKPFGKDAVKYSMRIKFYRSASTENFGTPGPGSYKPVTKINLNGTYIVSKNENVHPVEFSKDKTERFNYHYEITPGPSDYRKGSMFGKIFDSKFRSTNGITMRPKTKILDSRDCYPGPGAYKYFSEFGIYEKDDSNKRNYNRNTSRSVVIKTNENKTMDKEKEEIKQ